MDDLENAMFKVRLEDDKTTLCHGTIWECERWIRQNGELDVPYCIVRLKRKEKKDDRHT